MNRFLHLSVLFSLLIALSATVADAGNHPGNNGGGGNATGNKGEGGEFGNGNKGSGNTGDTSSQNCSVVFAMNVGELQSEMGGQDVHLRIKRLKPSPLLFTPQSLFFDSPLASELFDVEEDASETAVIEAQTTVDIATSDLSDAQQAVSDLQQLRNDLLAAKETERIAGGYSSSFVPPNVALPEVGDVVTITGISELDNAGNTVNTVDSIDTDNLTFTVSFDGPQNGDPLLVSEVATYTITTSPNQGYYGDLIVGSTHSADATFMFYGLDGQYNGTLTPSAYSRAYWLWKPVEDAYNQAYLDVQIAQSDLDAANSALVSAQAARDTQVQERSTSGSFIQLPSARVCGGINVLRPNGTGIDYRPVDGRQYWEPQGEQVYYESRIVPREPTVCARVDGKGREFQFDVAQKAIPVFKDQKGRKIRRDSPGARQEVIKKSGVMRQICTPQALSDIVVLDEYSYEVSLYRPSDVGSKNAEGVFVPAGTPFAKFKVENPTRDSNQLNRVKITSTKGNREKVREWQYSESAMAWDFLKDGGDIEVNKTITEINGNEELYRWENTHRDTSNQPRLCGVRTEVIKEFGWGKMATRKVLDPEGANLVHTYDYFTDANQTGKYGKIKAEVKPDGSWVTMDYDSEGRETIRIEPWLDALPGSAAAAAKATYFNYAPVDPNDTPLEYDLRPRTKTVKVLNQITKKTFYAYFDNLYSEHVEVVEMAAAPTAAYGDSANLRRTKTYYAKTEDEDLAGRLKTEEHPDGRLDTYSYERLADNTFITTVVHGVIESPDGVAYKTTREVTTLDPEGNETVKEAYVYTGTDYELVETLEKDFNERGQITERRRNGRVLYTAVYENGLRVSKTDEQGITINYTYDAHERVETETKVGIAGQADIVTSYTYDGEDRVLKKEVRGGSLREEWSYDLAGRKTTYRDQNGYLTSYAYENDGRKVTQTNPDTSVVVTERFRDGQTKSICGSGVVDAYFAYTVHTDGSITDSKTIGRTDSLRVLSTTKDILGRVIEQRRPGFGSGDFVQTYQYNEGGQLVKQSETDKADTLFVYDSARQAYRTGLDMDANGLLDLASIDRITDEASSYYQDLAGDFWRSIRTNVYATAGSAQKTLLSDTRVRLNGYGTGEALERVTIDANGNENSVLTIIDRNNATRTITTDVAESSLDAVDLYVNGLLQSRTTTTVSEPKLFTYDLLGRLRTFKEPRHTQASTVHYRRHVYGQTVIPPEPPAVASPHEHEASSNLIASVTDAAGHTTRNLYYDDGEQGAGRLKSSENALGQFKYNGYNLRGQRIRSWGDSAYPVEYSYNEFGEQSSITTYRSGDASDAWAQSVWPEAPPAGDVTTRAYDEATGLLTAKTDAKAESITYTYTTAGRMAERFWARRDGQGNPLKTTYTYDPLTGERTGVDYADSTPDLAYTYDRLGRQATVTDAAGSRSFDYKDDLQLESETIASFYGAGKRLTRSYETGTPGIGVVGRYLGFSVGTVADPDVDYTVSYGFDGYGRLNAVTDANHSYRYDYASNSNLLASVTSPVHTTNYTYETNRDLKTQVQNGSYSTYAYRYDAIGRRTDRVQSGSVFAQASFDAFDYNTRSEVIGSNRYLGTDPTDTSDPVVGEVFAYDFDPIGNRLSASVAGVSESYATNGLNQYTQVSGLSTQPVHDVDGNLTEQGNWFYKWNAENRLIEATDFTNDQKLAFVYDYLGRRVEKQVTQISTGTVISEERFLYDGWNLVATFTLSNLQTFTLSQTHTWGLDLSGSLHGAGGVGGLLGVAELNGTHAGIYHFAFDANGNVSEVLDNNGAIAAHYEYSPFGEVIRSSGGYADANPFRFSSKYWDDETGFYYYGYRYYDPATGRWLSRDPIEEEGGVNLYGFVGNDPTRLIDARGEFGFVGAAIGAVSGGVGGFIAGSKAGGFSEALKGAAIGTAVGAAVGLVAPQASGVAAGAAVGAAIGGISSAAGQAAGGLVNNQSLGHSISNIDKGAVAGATIGGALGGAWSAGNALVNGTSVSNQLAGAAGEGFITGVGEMVGDALNNSQGDGDPVGSSPGTCE